jgi:hypothetical protein
MRIMPSTFGCDYASSATASLCRWNVVGMLLHLLQGLSSSSLVVGMGQSRRS